MVALDEDSLICDFAETYRIYNYRELPARMAAIYAVGLRHDARIQEKINGLQVPVNTLLLASIADAMHISIWQKSKAAADGGAMPQSIVKALTGQKEPGFDTEEEFDRWRESMLGE